MVLTAITEVQLAGTHWNPLVVTMNPPLTDLLTDRLRNTIESQYVFNNEYINERAYHSGSPL